MNLRRVIDKSVKKVNKVIKGHEFVFDFMDGDVTPRSTEVFFLLRSKTHPSRTIRAKVERKNGKWSVDTLSFTNPGFEFIDKMREVMDSILSSYIDPDDYCIWRVGYLSTEEKTDYKLSGKVYPESMFKVWVDFENLDEVKSEAFIAECKNSGILSIAFTPVPKEIFKEYRGKENSRETYMLDRYIHSLAKNNGMECSDIIMCFGKPWKIRENSLDYEDGFSEEEIYCC